MSEIWVGRTLSKVQIQRLIGRGGMADVYIGLHTTLNVPRAVKILHGHLTDDPDLQRRFRDEAKSVAALRHPNIVQVYDFDLAEGSPYIIMEMLRGLSMSAYLKGLHQVGHSLPLEAVGRLLDRIASALDYAHSQGIVHRDVKPANVILRQGTVPLSPSIPLPDDAEPVLTDFGIARISGATTQTLTGTILGTPAYMSPEQVRGETVDARSDNYSLGIMLYEMLAGVLPFDPEVDTTASVLYKQANVPPPPLANINPRIQSVVDRALRKEKDARFQRAGDLAEGFRDATRAGATTVIVRSEAASAPPPTSPPPSARGFRPRPLWIGLAALGAVLLCAGAIAVRALTAPSAGTPPAQPSSAPTSIAEATVPPTEAPAIAASTAPAVPVAGGALFQDASLQGIVREVPAPESGFTYSVWLVGLDGTSQLAGADYSDGTLSILFVDPDGENLLAGFNEFAVSLEPDPDPAPDVPGPIRYAARAPQGIVDEIRRLDETSNGAPTSQSLLDGLRREAETHDSHLGFAQGAVEDGNLSGAKQHAEHTINVLEGLASPAYGDWDESTRAENPGDGFGLIPYLRLALGMALSELENPDASPQTLDALRTLATELETAIALAQESSETAQRMTAVDTIDEIEQPAADWSTMLLVPGVTRIAQQLEDVGLRLWTPVTVEP